MLKEEEGRPFGEMLMCFPVKGAEPVKKMGCFMMYSSCWGSRDA
jgi:hypothetical protein